MTMTLLLELASLCQQSATGYSKAVRLARSHSFRGLLALCAKHRREAAAELERQLNALRETPHSHPASVAALPASVLTFQTLSSRHDQIIVDTCKKGEVLMREVYQDALERELPSQLHEILRRQLVEADELRQRIGLYV